MVVNGKYIAPTKWEECDRDDLKVIPKMVAMGFDVKFSSDDLKHNRTTIDNIPHNAVGFIKGDKHVWKLYNYQENDIDFYWMTAKVVNDAYVNLIPLKNIFNITL